MLSLVPRRGAHPLALALAVALALGLALPVTAAHADTTLLNVSYDPTRELYQEFNARLRQALEGEVRRGRHHQAVARRLRQAGPRRDRRPRGRRRDAGARRTTSMQLADNGKLVPPDWQKRLPDNTAPYTSTIVFLVRKGNPKGIKDWDDLAKPGSRSSRPIRRRRGGARWNYLAAWGYALKQPGGSDAKAQRFRDQTSTRTSGARLRRARLHHDFRASAASATC